MTAPARLRLAPAQEAAELAAFLGRLIRWDKAAVVRLRSAAGEPALGVFGHPPFGGVLAVRTAALDGPEALGAAVDATVSAGQLLEAVALADGTGSGQAGDLVVPGSVTGPSWAGVLPPRGGWVRAAEIEADALRGAAARAIGEFRTRTEELAAERRTRVELDALAEELWARPLGGEVLSGESRLTLRVVHAAHALGFLRGDEPGVVLAAGPWLRLRTGTGSVALRSGSPATGLTVTPA